MPLFTLYTRMQLSTPRPKHFASPPIGPARDKLLFLLQNPSPAMLSFGLVACATLCVVQLYSARCRNPDVCKVPSPHASIALC